MRKELFHNKICETAPFFENNMYYVFIATHLVGRDAGAVCPSPAAFIPTITVAVWKTAKRHGGACFIASTIKHAVPYMEADGLL